MRYIPLIILSLVMLSCKNERSTKIASSQSADEIIEKSIELSGGERFKQSFIHFDFRDKHYYAKRKNGLFELSRSWINGENDSVNDILSNKGFNRMLNGTPIKVEDSMAIKYGASVNSVHYFSVLPFGLNDAAVNKELMGEEEINNNIYSKIKVTFNQEGGGEDFEDVFIYWINKKSHYADYLAYSYNEEDGVGLRFRQAYNERYIKGLRFVDYNNFKPKSDTTDLEGLAEAFESNQLELLSKIELENISVELFDF